MELPRLKSLYEKYRDQGFEIVAIDRSNDRERASVFVRENALPYVFLDNGTIDADEIVGRVFGNRIFPTSYLLDRAGRILSVHIGFEEGDEAILEQELRPVLE